VTLWYVTLQSRCGAYVCTAAAIVDSDVRGDGVCEADDGAGLHVDDARPSEGAHEALPSQERRHQRLAGLADGVVHVLRPAHQEAIVNLAYLDIMQPGLTSPKDRALSSGIQVTRTITCHNITDSEKQKSSAHAPDINPTCMYELVHVLQQCFALHQVSGLVRGGLRGTVLDA
jgi:hypothetical protein